MLAGADGVPVRAALPLRGRRRRGRRCRRSREIEPGHQRRVLQPGARRRVGAHASGDRRMSATALVEVDEPQGLLPDQERHRARPPRRRHQGRRRRHARRSSAARRSGSSASRAAASRRSAARSSGSTSRPPGGSSSTARTSRTLGEAELRPLRRRMQMVFQDPFASLNPRHTVGRIVGEPLRVARARATRRGARRASASCSSASGCRPTPAARYPHEFSGGQRQRIGIARALASTRTSSSADEPVSALDVSIQAQIINLLEELQDEFELTYLFIAHDLAVVRHISDRIAVMYLGTIVEVSPADELYENPLHPYTISLLSAVPIPDPWSSGSARRSCSRATCRARRTRRPRCRFHTRCPYVQPTRCRDEVPPLRPLLDGHTRRVPLGRGDQDRRAPAARAGAGLRARAARWSRSPCRRRPSGGPQDRVALERHDRELRRRLAQERARRGRARRGRRGRLTPGRVSPRRGRPRSRGARRRPAAACARRRRGRRRRRTRARGPAPPPGATMQRSTARSRASRSSSRQTRSSACEPVAQPRRVLVAARVGELGEPAAQPRQRERRPLELVRAQRARRELRAAARADRPDRSSAATTRTTPSPRLRSQT